MGQIMCNIHNATFPVVSSPETLRELLRQFDLIDQIKATEFTSDYLKKFREDTQRQLDNALEAERKKYEMAEQIKAAQAAETSAYSASYDDPYDRQFETYSRAYDALKDFEGDSLFAKRASAENDYLSGKISREEYDSINEKYYASELYD